MRVEGAGEQVSILGQLINHPVGILFLSLPDYHYTVCSGYLGTRYIVDYDLHRADVFVPRRSKV